MKETAIRLEGVRKQFGRGRRRVTAVADLSLEVAAGQVYGFLGPNGAGKSTTIRMLLDLIRPTAGSVYVFDRPVRQDHGVLAGRVGAMVEHASFYEFLTGRRNLRVLAETSGCYDEARVKALLTQVGMADRADRRVRGYSTGMRQRLGLAAALLNDPDLVLLDEPTNGLDPAGIQEMRHFIRRLVDERGKTVFLSSHMLSEVEQVCDRVAIIDQGRLVREGPVAELLAEQSLLELEVESAAAAAAVAALAPRWTATEEAGLLVVPAGRAEMPAILATLVAADIAVFAARQRRRSLEDVFLAVTGGGSNETA